MALPYGTRWAIYILLAKHEGQRGLQSQLKTTFDTYVGEGMSNHDSLVRAAQEQIDPGIQPDDIKPLQTMTAEDLRPALGLDGDYDPTQGPCPNGIGDGGERVDHQKAIANALVAMTGPVPSPVTA